ncbi:hypothetical protein L5515_016492 [Caenorhabditis briggsae]|uniref:Uncharacterized protein n=1 Tax=Caenorhabditis briggsae TaxID=6238 RepID=A0AAE9JNP6_CAEBR|nr:hypothetical protein L5515_016492 [Caenorhabditis briggsae]
MIPNLNNTEAKENRGKLNGCPEKLEGTLRWTTAHRISTSDTSLNILLPTARIYQNLLRRYKFDGECRLHFRSSAT